ncbi:MAG: hypothetical protein LBP36_01455 [Oscillospiraceae bacterium]|nr:hypothetical protein [Oscillospiraceae bacterium]
MKYYEEFKAHLDESLQKLRIATIFSFSSTTDALPDEGFENEKLDKTLSRLFG